MVEMSMTMDENINGRRQSDGALVPVDDTDALAVALTRFAGPSLLEDCLARRERCRERFGSKKKFSKALAEDLRGRLEQG